jgi:putative hydrolase of the HAD superfamily
MFDLIAFDADDTLWHNESIYSHIQTKLVRLLAEYADAETVVQRLYDTEMRNLEYYGYGIKSFTLSMIETAVEVGGDRITGADIRQIIDFGKEMLTAKIQLLDHVAETVAVLAERNSLMLLTKGDLRDQEWKLANSGLGHYFQYVEIVSNKNEQIYAALLEKYQIAPPRFLMVGNSLRSDILPVVALGGQAVHIPYHITWQHEMVHNPPVDKNGYYELEHMGQLLEFLDDLLASE